MSYPAPVGRPRVLRTLRALRASHAARVAVATVMIGATQVVAARVVAAQAAPAQQPSLTLGEVVDPVERANPLLDAARASARAAAAMVPGARRPPDPVLQLGWMNYQLPGLRPMEGLGMTQLQLMQMLPLGGKLRAAGDAAAGRAAASTVRVAGVAFDLRARTAMAFYDLYATDGGLDAARDSRRLLATVADAAVRMYEVGEGRQADVLRAGVELARMDEDIIRMRAMRDVMAARLNALQLAPDTARVGEPRIPAFPRDVPTLDSLVRLADAERPMLRAAALDVRAAASQADLARRELWPDLQVGVQLGRSAGEMGPETMGSLMLGASIPLFAGSRQMKMREEANAMRAMADADLAAMRADTRGAVAEALANLTRARRLAHLYGSSVLPQAEATVTASLAAYQVGDVNLMTMLDAQMTLNRYRTDLFTLEADEGKAWADLEMLTGRVLVDAHSAQPLRRTGGSPR